MIRFFLVLLAVLLTAAAPAVAKDPRAFQTPSGNIHCLVFEKTLRCDILQITGPGATRPASCDLDYGHAFAMKRTGRSSILCAGDTVANRKGRKLAYGKTWKRDGLTCVSRTSGLTCTNQSRHGFVLSKARQSRF